MYCTVEAEGVGVRFMIGGSYHAPSLSDGVGAQVSAEAMLTGLDSEDLAKFEKPPANRLSAAPARRRTDVP